MKVSNVVCFLCVVVVLCVVVCMRGAGAACCVDCVWCARVHSFVCVCNLFGVCVFVCNLFGVCAYICLVYE